MVLAFKDPEFLAWGKYLSPREARSRDIHSIIFKIEFTCYLTILNMKSAS